ncbi:MAG: acetoacetate decarboxylase family protein [Nitrososphaerales archaeon]
MSKHSLKGFCLPLSPEGKASLMGAPPWHYAVDLLSIIFRADEDAVRSLLPEPLEPYSDPALCYAWFGDWLSIWDGGEDMLYINPERAQYKELLVGVYCRYRGVDAQRCVYAWVDNDFTMLRGWFMGFPKKIGRIHLIGCKSNLYGLLPTVNSFGVGSRLAAICEAHGERLAYATLTIKREATPEELPKPLDLIHTRHFPNIDVENKGTTVHELVQLQTQKGSVKVGKVWAGDATLQFYDSDIEELSALQPKEIVAGYYFSIGFTTRGTRLLHRYKE